MNWKQMLLVGVIGVLAYIGAKNLLVPQLPIGPYRIAYFETVVRDTVRVPPIIVYREKATATDTSASAQAEADSAYRASQADSSKMLLPFELLQERPTYRLFVKAYPATHDFDVDVTVYPIVLERTVRVPVDIDSLLQAHAHEFADPWYVKPAIFLAGVAAAKTLLK